MESDYKWESRKKPKRDRVHQYERSYCVENGPGRWTEYEFTGCSSFTKRQQSEKEYQPNSPIKS